MPRIRVFTFTALTVIILIATLYALSGVNRTLFQLFQLVFSLRLIITFILGTVFGFFLRSILGPFIRSGNDYRPNNNAMRQTIRRKMPKKPRE